MEKKNSHWRKIMNTKFLSGDELEKDGQVVTIESYKEEQMFSQESKQKEPQVILKFSQIQKPMILTTRKAKQISKVLSTPQMDEWVGKSITIYPKQEKHFGEFFAVINVKPGAIAKQILNSKHPKWEDATKAIKSGASSIEAIEKHYSLTEAVRTSLTLLIPKSE